MKKIVLTAALAATFATSVAAQTAPAPAAPVAAVDPARLQVARDLVELMLPPATREQMIDNMLRPLMANIRHGMEGNPQFVSLMGDPKARAVFDTFMVKQEQRTIDLMRANLPGMIPAMATAYARTFDLQQLRDIRAFFETPTGRIYMQKVPSIMADPAIAEWQRHMMTEAVSHMKEDMQDLARQFSGLEKAP